MIIAPTSHTESSANMIRDASVAERDTARDVEKKKNLDRHFERRQLMEARQIRNREANVQRSRDAFDSSIKKSMEQVVASDRADNMVRAVIRERATESRVTDRPDTQRVRQRTQDSQIDKMVEDARERRVEQDAMIAKVREKVKALYSDQVEQRDARIKQREFEETSARERQKAANAYRDDNNRSAIDRTVQLVV